MGYIIKMFLKFGEEKYMRELLEHGKIFLNSIERFRSIEDDQIRGDAYEGISKVINYNDGILNIKNDTIDYTGRYKNIHLTYPYDLVYGNIYSLYCISSFGFEKPEDIYLDSKLCLFGSHCVMIKDNQEFMKRICNALDLSEHKYHHGFVKYYDKYSFNGNPSIFEKPASFEYQKEFRFYVERLSTEPMTINIGSLESIAELHSSNDIINTLEFRRTG